MPLPVLLAVDEDPGALGDVERQLVQRYANEYRVECVGDPQDVLELLPELTSSGHAVALMLVGQRVADTVSGTELLERVRQLHPDAKRGLLVPPDAWAD